jgi:hypothetical protein
MSSPPKPLLRPSVKPRHVSALLGESASMHGRGLGEQSLWNSMLLIVLHIVGMFLVRAAEEMIEASTYTVCIQNPDELWFRSMVTAGFDKDPSWVQVASLNPVQRYMIKRRSVPRPTDGIRRATAVANAANESVARAKALKVKYYGDNK